MRDPDASAIDAYLDWLDDLGISPWIVVDELTGTGESAVRRLLAARVKGEEGERLRALLARRGEVRDAEVRARLASVDERLAKRQLTLARSLAKTVAAPPGSILAVRALDAAAGVEKAARDFDAEIALRERAAVEAERLGWLSGAEERFASAAAGAHGRHRASRALGLWDQAIRVALAAGSAKPPAYLLHGRAATLAADGQLLAATDAYDRAIERSSAEGSLEVRLASEIGLAGAHGALGHYARALTLLERALAEARPGGSLSPEVDAEELRASAADALMHLTAIAIYLGRWDAARVHATEALAGARALAKQDEDLVGACLGNMSLIEAHDDDAGALGRATGYFDEAVSRFEALRDMRSVSQAMENWAVMLARRGDGDLALHHAQAAEAALLEDGGSPLELASVHITLGDLLRRNGATSAALDQHRTALGLLRKSEARAELARVLTALAQDHLASKEKDATAALAAAKEAFLLLGGVVGGLGDSESVAAKEELYPLFETGASAALALDDRAALAWFLEGGRAGSLLEALGSREGLETAVLSPELLRRKATAAEASRRTLRSLAEAATADAPDPKDTAAVAAWTAALAAARAARAAALRELSAVSDAIQRERGASLALPKPLELAGISSRLAPDEALVLYTILEGRLLALVVRRNGAPSVVDLKEEKPIAKAVEELRAALPLKSADWVGTLAKVRELLVDPLKLPADVHRVLVSPDGSLGYLPFPLLLADTKLLAEGKPGALTRDVAFVPSGTVLAFLRDEAKAAKPAAPGAAAGEVLALGDPVYETADAKDTSPLARMRSAFSLERLEHSAGEVAAVGTKGRVFVREKATEATLRAELSKQKTRLRALHLACHGLLDLDQPLASGLALTIDGQDDGLLTTMEILGLRIPADLVVLSACQSGLGWTARGEGIVGFTRAFLHAGAPRVVASLWNVNDEATSELMKRMYAAWKPGAPAASALRTAQESIRTDKAHAWSHPRYWAPWVLWGLPE